MKESETFLLLSHKPVEIFIFRFCPFNFSFNLIKWIKEGKRKYSENSYWLNETARATTTSLEQADKGIFSLFFFFSGEFSGLSNVKRGYRYGHRKLERFIFLAKKKNFYHPGTALLHTNLLNLSLISSFTR